MLSGKTTKRRLQGIANTLLALSLVYIAWHWLSGPEQPNLDKLVVKHALSGNAYLYGARDNSGGATTGFSYRYYVGQDWDDKAALKKLQQAHAFLVSDDDAVQAQESQGLITLTVNGRVFDYQSNALIRTQDDYRQIHFALQQTPRSH